jgi:hypothetical protein
MRGDHPMTFQEKTIQCSDCGASFAFTTGEQEFYQAKGFTNEPKRCPFCRKANKDRRADSANNSYATQR